MKTNYKKVLEVIANHYNLTEELLEIKHEYKCNLTSTWYAIIVKHDLINTCYLATWRNKEYSRIEIKEYEGTLNPKALTDLYEYIIA